MYYFYISQDSTDKKIWLTGKHLLKVKLPISGADTVVALDTSHIKKGIDFKPSTREEKLNIKSVALSTYTNTLNIIREISGPVSIPLDLPQLPDTPAGYPFFQYVGDGETEIDEPAGETIVFPPKETPDQFIERISARLLHFSRRISILRHEEPHLSSRSRRVCLDLDDRDEYVHRYDHSINLCRLPAGWLQLQLNTYIQRHQNHKKRVAKAKAANRKLPTFNQDRMEGEIETLLDKMETHLTKDALLKHHETHDTDEWRNAHAGTQDCVV